MLSAGATNVENARRMLQTMIFDVAQEYSQIARLVYLVSKIAAILGTLFFRRLSFGASSALSAT